MRQRIPWTALRAENFPAHADDVAQTWAREFAATAQGELTWLRGVIGSDVLNGATRAAMARALKLAALEVEQCDG
jgi:hypothetical protein